MRERTSEHLKTSAIRSMEGFLGSRITLKWLASSTGTWDEGRQEYVGGTNNWALKENVPCMVKTITAGDVRFGRWGMCEGGDLVICINSNENITSLANLRIILNKQEYKVMPNTTIPITNISALIGNASGMKAIHARYMGDQIGVIQ